jgi:multicomponent Na+:H+ antiporter subunit E
MVLWNIVLAAVWAFAVGELSLLNLTIGFTLGYAVLWLGRNVFGAEDYCARLPRLLELLLYFFWKLIQANLRVAHDVITPKHRMRPGIIAVPLDARTDGEITLLASMLTLTPGSLSLEVSPDRQLLFVHVLYLRDVEAEKRTIKEGFERRLLEVLR